MDPRVERTRQNFRKKQVPKFPTFPMKRCLPPRKSDFPDFSIQIHGSHGRRAECDAAPAALAIHLSPIPGPPLRPDGNGVPAQGDSVD